MNDFTLLRFSIFNNIETVVNVTEYNNNNPLFQTIGYMGIK